MIRIIDRKLSILLILVMIIFKLPALLFVVLVIVVIVIFSLVVSSVYAMDHVTASLLDTFVLS